MKSDISIKFYWENHNGQNNCGAPDIDGKIILTVILATWCENVSRMCCLRDTSTTGFCKIANGPSTSAKRQGYYTCNLSSELPLDLPNSITATWADILLTVTKVLFEYTVIISDHHLFTYCELIYILPYCVIWHYMKPYTVSYFVKHACAADVSPYEILWTNSRRIGRQQMFHARLILL